MANVLRAQYFVSDIAAFPGIAMAWSGRFGRQPHPFVCVQTPPTMPAPGAAFIADFWISTLPQGCKAISRPSAYRGMLPVGAGSALPRPRDLKQRRFAEVAADELHRQWQAPDERPAIIASAGWPVTLNGVRACLG